MTEGLAHPDKKHTWGAFEILTGGPVSMARSQWFAQRAEAVTYARAKFGRRYAIARAWGEAEDFPAR